MESKARVHLDFYSPPLTPNQIRRQHGPRTVNVDAVLGSPLRRSLLIVEANHPLQPTSLDLNVFEMREKFWWDEARDYVLLEINGRIVRVLTFHIGGGGCRVGAGEK